MYNSIDEVIDKIKEVLNNKSVISIFAYNGTGKTRITRKIEDARNQESEKLEALCYSSFFTDIMTWNDEQNCLRFDNTSDILTIAIDEGLDSKIIYEFNSMVGNNIVPLLDLVNNELKFKSKENDEFIKISKGEEDLFYWSWFTAILENMYDNLIENNENRSVHIYDKIRYVIIDDPVSSLDDAKIIALAVKISEYIEDCREKKLGVKFIITTHHTLFYNVIFNELRQKNSVFYELRNTQEGYQFEEQSKPMPYHLYVKEIIDNAIKNDEIYRFHFNMFRNLLEKTAIYLGYNKWSNCIDEINENNEFCRIINNFSHNDVDGLENKSVPEEHKVVFIKVYNDFIRKFNFK